MQLLQRETLQDSGPGDTLREERRKDMEEPGGFWAE